MFPLRLYSSVELSQGTVMYRNLTCWLMSLLAGLIAVPAAGALGLVVVPGFIDLHAHGQTNAANANSSVTRH